MDILMEFEYLSQREQLLEKLKSKYEWVQKKSKEGAKDYFVKQWNEFFDNINDFFIAEDEYIIELKRTSKGNSKRSTSIENTVQKNYITPSRPYNPLNRKAKEAFRDDWNLQQRTKWMDHY